MKAIMVMFDSLNRHFLPNYGCEWTHAPSFERLGEKTVTFDNCYTGSLPCMPARRELHTGRYNFLHRSWGPLEPFDDSLPELLRANCVYTHLISDHGHYWEDGGGTYHNRYNSWEISRGQEGDIWKGNLDASHTPTTVFGNRAMQAQADWRKGGQAAMTRQDAVNRTYYKDEADHPQTVTFDRGLEFIQTNHDYDDWFLQIETFDPHEPFFSYEQYRKLYPDHRNRPLDWPPYAPVIENEKADGVVEDVRNQYAALLSMCDHSLGRVLDMMDQYNMWDDTMLIVNTDHGFMLGEHDWWGKMAMPFYQEIVHTPLFIWDPRTAVKNQRRDALVQSIDIPATLLDFFGVALPNDMEGRALRDTILENKPIREAALFGMHGGDVYVTDGRYVYRRAPDPNAPLFNYTLMPTHMRLRFSVEELQDIALAPPFDFTKGCKLMKIAANGPAHAPRHESKKPNVLFDLQNDPEEMTEIVDAEVEARMVRLMTDLMRKNNAPIELYERLGL